MLITGARLVHISARNTDGCCIYFCPPCLWCLLQVWGLELSRRRAGLDTEDIVADGILELEDDDDPWDDDELHRGRADDDEIEVRRMRIWDAARVRGA